MNKLNAASQSKAQATVYSVDTLDRAAVPPVGSVTPAPCSQLENRLIAQIVCDPLCQMYIQRIRVIARVRKESTSQSTESGYVTLFDAI